MARKNVIILDAEFYFSVFPSCKYMQLEGGRLVKGCSNPEGRNTENVLLMFSAFCCIFRFSLSLTDQESTSLFRKGFFCFFFWCICILTLTLRSRLHKYYSSTITTTTSIGRFVSVPQTILPQPKAIFCGAAAHLHLQTPADRSVAPWCGTWGHHVRTFVLGSACGGHPVAILTVNYRHRPMGSYGWWIVSGPYPIQPSHPSRRSSCDLGRTSLIFIPGGVGVS